ncbi:hypothetical protein [Exiguobacterium sp. s133]|uniref:hypothetical protein n=1 Tax=Exiguobacterium sp. s133 TaxID=2751213 RepID=UPI001BEBB76F|nr:hypothetical protein [Exiguobacterium sp. s133]
MTTLIKSNVLDEKTKQKVIRSYIRGEDMQCIANLRGLSLLETQKIVEDMWQEARNTGKTVRVTQKRSMTTGEIELYGKMSKYVRHGFLRSEFNLSYNCINRLLDVYRKMVGEEFVGEVLLDSHQPLMGIEKMNINHITSCPCCGHKTINIISSAYEDSSPVELKTIFEKYDIDLTAAKQNYYCKECFSEFFLISHEKKVEVDGIKKMEKIDHPYNGIVKFNHWAMKEV